MSRSRSSRSCFGALTVKRNAEHQSWLTLAQTTLERWPTDVAHAAVGSELSRLRRDEEALPLLRIGARSDVRARYNLGITLFNLKRYDEAIRELEVLVTEHPMREEVPWSRRVMGHAYAPPVSVARSNRATSHDACHDATRRRSPEAPGRCVSGLGVDLAQRQKFRRGDRAVSKRAQLDEQNAGARYNLATALFDAGQMKEAFAEARARARAGPSKCRCPPSDGQTAGLARATQRIDGRASRPQ